jgi:hypothetical protein
MKEIELTKGYKALVDDNDYDWLSQWKWHCCDKSETSPRYAARCEYLGMVDGKPKNKHVSMHRVITGAKRGLEVDHINGNGIDNRRDNLRVCTRKQNSRNVSGRSHSSKYKGVSWDKRRQWWRANIRANHKFFYIGVYQTEEDAAKAYDQKAKEFFGEYARPNFS